MDDNSYIKKVKVRKDGVIMFTLDSKIRKSLDINDGDYVKFIVEKVEIQ